MNKQNFVDAIAQKRGITKKEAKSIADDVLSIIEDAVATSDGKENGFAITGSFALKTVYKPAKTKWSEMLQKDINVPAKTVVKLTVGKPLKERVQALTAQNSSDVKPF